jgi:osmotically-inducible protein OsmY
MKLKRILTRFVLFFTLAAALVATALAERKPITDDFLVDTIRSKLAADPVVKGGAIEVICKDGAVILKGAVEEDRQKSKAEKIAKRVSGVKSVTNEITITHP